MRRGLLAAAAIRAVVEVAAIPLAPLLFRKHVALLVLLRPTKETLLFAGFALHRHHVSLPALVVAAAPLLLLGVWQFFALGRMFRRELAKADLPGIAGRILPRNRVRKMQSAIDREGEKVVVLGRFAAMPSSLVAAAAGASGMEWRRFVLFDSIGAVGSFILMVGVGWFLEDAYETAGLWLTALGVAALAAVGIVVGRALTREGERRRGTPAAASRR